MDVIGQMALLDRKLSTYVQKAQVGTEAESELLLYYTSWVPNHDQTAVTGLVEEIKKLTTPLFTSQGVLQLALKFMVCFCFALQTYNLVKREFMFVQNFFNISFTFSNYSHFYSFYIRRDA